MTTRLKPKEINNQRDLLLKKQKNKCGICKEDLSDEDTTNQHVDHCHITGYIRGVLCRKCNLLEGTVKHKFGRSGHINQGTDYIQWLKSLVAYLEAPTTEYIHPTHLTVLVREFKKKKVPAMKQELCSMGIEFPEKIKRDELIKLFKKNV